MRITLGKCEFAVSQPFFGMKQLLPKVWEVKTTNVFKFDTFEKIPDTFLGVQVGRITRQTLDLNPFGSTFCQKRFDEMAFMNARAIPNDEDLACNLAQEKL